MVRSVISYAVYIEANVCVNVCVHAGTGEFELYLHEDLLHHAHEVAPAMPMFGGDMYYATSPEAGLQTPFATYAPPQFHFTFLYLNVLCVFFLPVSA